MNALRLILIGTGNQSKIMADLVEDMNLRQTHRIELLGFLDDRKELWDTELSGYPVLGPIVEARNFAEAHFINGIYSLVNLARLPEIVERASVSQERWATLVHPLAYVSPRARLGHGMFVYPGVYVHCEAEIGDFVLLNPRSIVGVGAKIGWGSVIGSNAVTAGGVSVGKSCYLGQGCLIREHLRIGDGAIVGMGSVVVKNVPAGATVVGNPARPLPAHHGEG